MRKTQLILWPAGGQSAELAKDIAGILTKDYKLDDRVRILNVLTARKFRDATKDKAIEKGPMRPLITDLFGDGDPRVEGGEPEFAELNGHYLAVVKYMFEPESDMSINDFIMQVMAVFYVVNDNCLPLRKALIAPYLPYLRSHSVDKYKQRGFVESDRLKMLADILALCKIDDLFMIHPHSEKIGDYCSDRGITVHMRDTFRNDVYVDYRKLGFSSRQEAKSVLERQQPIVNHVRKLREEAEKDGRKFYIIVPDEGAESLVETLARDAGIDYDFVLNILKERLEAGEVIIKGIKDFCNVIPENLRGANCVVCDDMTSSGDTLDKIAAYLKTTYQFHNVFGIVSHAAVDDKSRFQRLASIDRIFHTDSIPYTDLPKAEVIPCSADILAASLLRSFRRELAKKSERLY